FPFPAMAGDRLLLARVLFGGLIFSLAVIAFELTVPHATADAHRAARTIARGPFAPLFWGGVVGAGLILPLLLLVIGSLSLIALAPPLSFSGLFFSHHLWVTAPPTRPL